MFSLTSRRSTARSPRLPAGSRSASTRTTSRARPRGPSGGSPSAAPDGRAQVRRAAPAETGEDGMGLASAPEADPPTEPEARDAGPAAVSDDAGRLGGRAVVVTGATRGI